MASFFRKQKHKEEGKEATETSKKPVGKSHTSAKADAIHPAVDGGKPAPLLDDEDEQFLEHLVSNKQDGQDEGPPPPLPPRPTTPVLTWDSDADSFLQPAPDVPSAPATGTITTATSKKQNRLSRLFSRKASSSSNTLTVSTPVPPAEADREWADLNGVLARLDIIAPDPPASTSASASKPPSKVKTAALTASAEVQSLLRQFVLILKDIMRGAPTAADDLVALLDGRNDALKRGFEKLPGSMQRLVTQLPKKITTSLGPELLAAAAEAQGLRKEDAGGKGGLGKLFAPRNLGDLVMTPAIVKSMLKAIVNALKVRWPAFVGTNVLWSAAVFLLLFVLWYFHKRGKEEREKMEKAEAEETEKAAVKEAVGEKPANDEEGSSSAVVVVDPPAESPRT